MTQSTRDKAHPSFVGKISSMTALDARIFAFVADKVALPTIEICRKTEGAEGQTTLFSFVNPDLIRIVSDFGISSKDQLPILVGSIENLSDLGLVKAQADGHLSAPAHVEKYKEMENGWPLNEFKKLDQPGQTFYLSKKSYVTISQTGKLFAEVVLA